MEKKNQEKKIQATHPVTPPSKLLTEQNKQKHAIIPGGDSTIKFSFKNEDT